MQDLWIKLKPTVLLVTHDLKEAGYLANRICVMRARPGQIIDDAEVPFARPRTIEMSYTPGFVSIDAAAARIDRHCAPQQRGRLNGPAKSAAGSTRRSSSSASSCCGKVLCWVFHVSDFVLPKPSQILVTLVERMPALWPHTVQTLYTTLIGFAFRHRHPAYCSARWSARRGSLTTSPIRC